MPDFDPVDLELFHHRLAGVAEEMGVLLQQAGYSPNIKERRDFSCAVFDANGDMVTHAAHIPVHLGSTPLSVRAAIEAVPMEPGDIIILNDPYSGGSHLPDVTLVAPVFVGRGRRPYAYVADRAHHADIGGSSPGSMALATDIHQEGFRIPPVHLYRRGKYVRETRQLFLANTRVSEERLGDLEAQIAALHTGESRIIDLCDRYGARTVAGAMGALQSYSRRLVERLLTSIPAGSWTAEDVLDDDGLGCGPIRIAVRWKRSGRRLVVDFAGSSPQVKGPLNANLAITTSAVFYVIACLGGRRIPANSGMMAPIEIRAPAGSVVHCSFPAAVAGGNVETSQRIVDVLLRALSDALPDRIPAASCGTMTNVAVGGVDSVRNRFFSYYETVGGGAGGGPRRAGAHALQTHMTNTLNTPCEMLETYFPFTVRHYRIRRGSGGAGRQPGGDGIDRELEILVDAQLTLLADRRVEAPYGLAGGNDGTPGRDELMTPTGRKPLPSKAMVSLRAGDRLRVRTPGGGGWGRPRR